MIWFYKLNNPILNILPPPSIPNSLLNGQKIIHIHLKIQSSREELSVLEGYPKEDGMMISFILKDTLIGSSCQNLVGTGNTARKNEPEGEKDVPTNNGNLFATVCATANVSVCDVHLYVIVLSPYLLSEQDFKLP